MTEEILFQYQTSKYGTTTKVKHLVAALLKQDQEALIYTEGCDCLGNAVAIEFTKAGDVLIARDDVPIQAGKIVDRYKDFFEGEAK